MEKSELIKVCNKLAELLRCWERFELGHEAPPPLNYLYVAAVLEMAAKEING